MRQKRLIRSVHLLMDPAQYDAVQAWGRGQRPPLDFSDAARTLLQRALDFEALKEPKTYLAYTRQIQERSQS